MSTGISAAAPASASFAHGEKTILGHPTGLYVLFFTEMWERFSYYGMRVLLVLYMNDYLIKHVDEGGYVLGFSSLRHLFEYFHGGHLATQPLSSLIYGNYTSLVYLTPLFGGMLSDRLLGQRKTVILGGVLMAIGHFLMAVESMFLLALFFLILGNGCFKPNISTQVGGLYAPGDDRRDRAFTIFYMGINLGAFLSPFICGTLGQVYSWHYGFGAAGVGMVLGLLVYIWGQKYLRDNNVVRARRTNVEQQKLTSQEWRAVIGLTALCLLNVVFWGVYEQQGNTLQLFADRNTDWHVFGWNMPSTWFQSVNPAFIFILTPLLTAYWGWQSVRKKELSSVAKMAAGCFMLGLSFLPLMWVTHGLQDGQRISFLWLVGCTLIYTLGELYLSPIGLSLVTKVAPARLVGMLMGMWFLSSFLGNNLSGYIGTFYEQMSKDNFFLLLAILSVASGIAIFAFKRPLKNAIGQNV